MTETRKSLRRDEPGLWAELVRVVREEVGEDWSEDEIANLIGKVRASDPDRLLDALGRVVAWCAAAMKSGNEEAEAAVSLWRTLPADLIEIHVDEDGIISHRINPDVDVEFVR